MRFAPPRAVRRPFAPSSPTPRGSTALVTGLVAVLVVALLAACTRGQADAGGPSPAAPTAGASAGPTGDRKDPATEAAYAAFYGQKPSWTSCRDGFECAKIKVPVNWAAPSGATIELSAIRKRATGTKIGTLWTNPGGPGVGGVQFLRDAYSQYGSALTKAYDIASWDTRGTGTSSPVKCLPNADLDRYYSEDATPDTPAETTQLVEDTKKYAAACEANTGDLLEHVDTLSTVKDMDVLRAVVGDSLLAFFGASYGTYLGAWYAQEFPWRTGRLVLDGAVDPSLSPAQYAEGQATGFARAVQGFVDDCLTRRDCPLRGTRAQAYEQLQRVLTQLDAKPLPTDQGRPLTQALFTTGMIQAMYAEQLWGTARTALTEVFGGRGTTMLLLADFYLERDETGKYGQTLVSFSPIYCLDHGDSRSVEEVAAQSAELGKKYPPFGDSIGWGSVSCIEWPIPAVVPQRKLTADGAAPILVVGTTDDPATPYEWAQGLAAQLSSGRLLTRKGEGHTGYGQGSACTDRAIEAYLVSGTVPAEGTTCT